MKNAEMEEHFVELTALGRSFKLGCLYNYCNDEILKGKFRRSLIFLTYFAHPICNLLLHAIKNLLC